MHGLTLRYKLSALFLIVFAIAFAVQIHDWFPAGITDETNWATAAQETAQFGFSRSPHDYGASSIEADPAFLYPGTTIILPAIALDHFGVDEHTAIRAAFAFVMALFIAFAVAAFAFVRPRIIWWLPAAAILIFGPYYFTTTVASAATVPLFVLIGILFVAIGEARDKRLTPALVWCAGIAGALALATRLDMSAIFLGTGLVMLSTIDRKSAVSVALISIGGFFLLDPFSWHAPLSYVLTVHAQMVRQEHVSFTGAFAWAEEFVWPIPLATISFSLFAIVLIFKRKVLPIPPRVVAWLITATILTCVVLLSASSRRLWYFYPYFALWETLLPLVLVGLVEALPQRSPRAEKILLYLMTAGLVLAYVLPVAL